MEATKLNRALVIFSAFIGLCVLVLIFNSAKTNRRYNDLQQRYIIAQDSLMQTTNRLKQQTTTVKVLVAEKEFIINDLNVKDKEIVRLKNLVALYEKQKGDLHTALTLTTETVISLQDSIRSLIVGYSDQVDDLNDSIKVVYPIYSRDFAQEWHQGTVTMGLDILDVTIQSKNEYDVTIGEEKDGLFKKKVYANVTNLNPNTDTKVMKVYQKEPVKTHALRKFTLGALAGIVGTLLLN